MTKRNNFREYNEIIKPFFEKYTSNKYKLTKLYSGSFGDRLVIDKNLLSIMGANKYLDFAYNKDVYRRLDFRLTNHDLFYRDIGVYLLEFLTNLNSLHYNFTIKEEKDIPKLLANTLFHLGTVHYLVTRAIELSTKDEDLYESELSYKHQAVDDTTMVSFMNKNMDERFFEISNKLHSTLNAYELRSDKHRLSNANSGNSNCYLFNKKNSIQNLLPLKLNIETMIEMLGMYVPEILYMDKTVKYDFEDREARYESLIGRSYKYFYRDL